MLQKMKEMFSEPSDLDGYDDLNPEDQERIQKALEEGHVTEEDIPYSARKEKGKEDKPTERAIKKNAAANDKGEEEVAEKPKRSRPTKAKKQVGPYEERREGYASYKIALDEAEKDKNGLMTEGDFDFGIVEPNMARSGVHCAAKIRLTTPTARIAMVSLPIGVLQGQEGGGRSCYIVPTSFEVTVEGANRNITTITPVTIQITFKQKHVSRYEDRLEMVFEDVQLAKRFLISKSLSAIVGNKADHEALKAKAQTASRRYFLLSKYQAARLREAF